MSSRFPSVCVALLLGWTLAAHAASLRICADPDNLPFSNRSLRGFDNRIAALVANRLHRKPEFIWARNGRGFVREQFNKDACDVLMGAPEKMRGVMTTVPYYRSAYVFVTRKRDHIQIASFSDPNLNGRKIGLQALEENLAPPSVALVRTGHAAQLVGFNSSGEHAPDIVRAVANGRLDASVVWGPIAGYFIARERLPLDLRPVLPLVDPSGVPFAYSMSIAVHKRDSALRDQLNRALAELKPSIQQILSAYHVPTLPQEAQ